MAGVSHVAAPEALDGFARSKFQDCEQIRLLHRTVNPAPSGAVGFESLAIHQTTRPLHSANWRRGSFSKPAQVRHAGFLLLRCSSGGKSDGLNPWVAGSNPACATNFQPRCSNAPGLFRFAGALNITFWPCPSERRPHPIRPPPLHCTRRLSIRTRSFAETDSEPHGQMRLNLRRVRTRNQPTRERQAPAPMWRESVWRPEQ